MGVFQWVWSSGCSSVGVSQDESVENISQRCGLEGNSGCSLMGISECGLEEKVCVLETTIGCSTAGITRFSGREQWV